MPRLVYRTAALRDLAHIATRIQRQSQSRQVANDYIEKIRNYCERLAAFHTMIGRPRAEIRPHFRSVTFGNYVIFLRYSDEDGPLSHLYVTRILWGSRDLDAYFRRALDDSGIE